MKEMLGQAAEFDTFKGQMGERIKMLEMQKQQMTSEQEAKYQDAIAKFELELE
jgi:hypothetical protein